MKDFNFHSAKNIKEAQKLVSSKTVFFSWRYDYNSCDET